ncbi:MAG TPA: sigma-70 family RNA polymerase sigma factor [Actinomycetes bacterium]|nr:sigma-70 family RNA polymerase sigma factor [Actinomycetes bacterium]
MDDEADAAAVAFCRRLRPRLVGTLSLISGDPGTAEELSQEALARAWSNWSRLRELEEPAAAAWVFRTATNLASSWLRRLAAERRAVARLAGRSIGGARGEPDLADTLAVRRQVATLPRRQRTALVLRYYADLPVSQVAAVMGCSPGTVKSLTSKAVHALRLGMALGIGEEVRDGA